MYSRCNLSFCFAVIVLFVNLNFLSPKLVFISRLFSKKTFFRINICNSHASSYVIMVDDVMSIRVNLVSSRRFF